MVSANLVKTLREKTGAGMMDCKKALSNCNGNIEEAASWLRKEGLSKANKKAGRETLEGLVAIATNDQQNESVIIELNSETDFVAKNEIFVSFAEDLSNLALKSSINKVEELKEIPFENSKVSDAIVDKIATLGENIAVNRLAKVKVDNGVVASYLHNAVGTNSGKIGVLVGLESNGDKNKLLTVGKKIAMHVAASKPLSLSIDGLDKEIVTREREVFAQQAIKSGKPEGVIEKMVEGKMQKFYEEVVLLDQAFILDGKMTISKLLEEEATKVGTSIKISSFIRFALGEK